MVQAYRVMSARNPSPFDEEHEGNCRGGGGTFNAFIGVSGDIRQQQRGRLDEIRETRMVCTSLMNAKKIKPTHFPYI